MYSRFEEVGCRSAFVDNSTTQRYSDTSSGSGILQISAAQMKITRSVDGLRFVAECDPDKGFVPGAIECGSCGRPIDMNAHSITISLGCPDCRTIPQIFWSEAQMHVFIAENWNALRQLCTGARATSAQHAS
jgi:hypothetical protein